MGQVTLQLSEEDIARAQRRAKNAGFSTEEYLQDVLVMELRDDTVEIVERIGPPPHLHVESMEQLEELLLEGMQGPFVEMTAEDFARTRLELIQKFSRRKE
jgi:hypothetical protein